MAQNMVFPTQPHPVKAARHRIQNLVGSKRFKDKINRTGTQCLDRGIQIGIGRHQDGIGKKADLALLGQPLNPGLARHDVIKDHDVEMMLIQKLGRFLAIGGFFHPLGARPQCTDKEIAHARLVINDQDRCLFQPRPEFRPRLAIRLRCR